MNSSLKGLKKLLDLGVRPGIPSETRRSIRLVNTLSLVTGGTALVLSPILTATTHKPILVPGLIEAACFFSALVLNYYRHYFQAALVMLATQNLAAVYFGMLFGEGIPIKMLSIALGITAVFIFNDLKARGIGLLVAFISMALLNINDYFHLVEPFSFTTGEHEMIKWLADGVIFALTCIVVMFFVQQNQRASENKTSFLRETNHEINKSLEAILNALDKYKTDKPGEDTLTIKQKDLKVMKIAAKTMADVVRNGLNLSRIEAGKYDIHENNLIETRNWLADIKNAYTSLANRKGIIIKLAVDADVPQWVESDRNKLTVILSNILSNAIKFSYNDAFVEFNVSAHQSVLTFQIRDFGKGMSKKKETGLFSSLYVSEKNELIEGYGVGMVLTKRYVEFLYGEIMVNSAEGQGTTFTVEVPVKVRDISNPQSHNLLPFPSASLPIILAGRNILLIEDDTMTREYGIKCLQQLGCTRIDAAADAANGMQKAINNIPDLIILDVQLPDKSGLDFLRELKHDPRLLDVPVIMASSENSDLLRYEVSKAGAALFLRKPYTIHELQKSITEILNIRV
ncbi:ATP-binding response regulator [Chitinophaga tropicalis]|uniref:histidine kinase n=1 Tax=Chitinophaga tropicalis TaxID=2683588 RepID=A0A7K1U4C1_9BACT|nr:response regulator [Chitinophaga tropicalis]MVT09189.1 response regulator [Chitinophaga tropicalis]